MDKCCSQCCGRRAPCILLRLTINNLMLFVAARWSRRPQSQKVWRLPIQLPYKACWNAKIKMQILILMLLKKLRLSWTQTWNHDEYAKQRTVELLLENVTLNPGRKRSIIKWIWRNTKDSFPRICRRTDSAFGAAKVANECQLTISLKAYTRVTQGNAIYKECED